MAIATLRHIDEKRLETDLDYRVDYLSEFAGFTKEDVATIHGAAGLLAPIVPGLVDAVYVKLFQQDATLRHFLLRNEGFSGPVPHNLEELDLNHPKIIHRKQHLANYLVRLVTGEYGTKMNGYLDMVGKIHTAGAGNQEIVVPLVQMNALMVFVSDAVIAKVMAADAPPEARVKLCRALNKLLWIQNDLISRHYVSHQEESCQGSCGSGGSCRGN